MTLSPKDKASWLSRWREGRIGFHVDKVNPILNCYVDRLLPRGRGRIFVPLCGKSVDLAWLVEQGHEVVGVELVEEAVKDLFMQLGQSSTTIIKSSFRSWTSEGLEVLVGDFFELDTDITGKFDAIWDRAAFVALRPSDRDRYALHLREFLRPNGYILLCTVMYDGEKMEGPPFSVSAEEVRRQFGHMLSVTKLEQRTINEPKSCFGNSGLDWVIEETWLIG